MTQIGWYIHHHGLGHLARFRAIRPHVRSSVVVCSSLPRPAALPPDTTWVELPRDDEDEGRGSPAQADPLAGGALHWAPIGHRGHATRMSMMAALAPRLDAFVVDVSVEVTLLARLLGVRVVLVAQPGDRRDEPHLLGRRLADVVLAPWPAAAASSATEAGLEHVGGISRHAARARSADRQSGTVLALSGGGDDAEWDAMLRAAQAAAPDRRWRLAGGASWLEDPWEALCAADVVVTAAGQNAIADVAAAGARAVVVPRPRPFGEQQHTAAALERLGLAVVVDDPDGCDWGAVLDRASALEPDWSRWGVPGAAGRAAAIIDRVADGGHP